MRRVARVTPRIRNVHRAAIHDLQNDNWIGQTATFKARYQALLKRVVVMKPPAFS